MVAEARDCGGNRWLNSSSICKKKCLLSTMSLFVIRMGVIYLPLLLCMQRIQVSASKGSNIYMCTK